MPGQAERLQTTGFVVLFVTPLVVMISASFARSLRPHGELAALLVLLGPAVMVALFWPRALRALAHRLSPDRRLLRQAREAAQLIRRSLEGAE